MRHDPDILLLGEMREMETIKLALGCASMGMLVFGTLHTNNAAKTVDRIINTFPADEQNQVRVMLSGCLAGVVAQLLCKRIPEGTCAVHEILSRTRRCPTRFAAVRFQHQIDHRERWRRRHDHDDNSPHEPVIDGHDRAEGKSYMPARAEWPRSRPLLKPGDLDGGQFEISRPRRRGNRYSCFRGRRWHRRARRYALPTRSAFTIFIAGFVRSF
jgi:twitching motility protein PilT